MFSSFLSIFEGGGNPSFQIFAALFITFGLILAAVISDIIKKQRPNNVLLKKFKIQHLVLIIILSIVLSVLFGWFLSFFVF